MTFVILSQNNCDVANLKQNNNFYYEDHSYHLICIGISHRMAVVSFFVFETMTAT